MKPLLLTSILLLLLGSCTRTLYVPNGLNTPLFASKGDYDIKVGSKLIAPVNFDLQGAYAPLDHFALMANASVIGMSRSDSLNAFNQFFMEGGAGVFTGLWENGCGQKRLRLELYGGYGFGSTEVTRPPSFFSGSSSLLQHEGSYHRKFLQPAVGLKGKRAELSIAARISEVNFSRYRDFTDRVQTGGGIYNFSTVEPVLTWAMRRKEFRVFTQLGFVIPTDKTESEFYEANEGSWSYGHLSLGVAFGSLVRPCTQSPTVSLRNDEKYPPPPPTIYVSQSNVTICLSDGGEPDGDVVAASFNGSYVLAETKLKKKPSCFEVTVPPGPGNLLKFHIITDGQLQPNTLKISIREGKMQRQYYLLTQTGKADEFYLWLK